MTKKVGRNEPCPCGSGLKYKKCCLPKETEKVENLDGWTVEGKEELESEEKLHNLLHDLISQLGVEFFGDFENEEPKKELANFEKLAMEFLMYARDNGYSVRDFTLAVIDLTAMRLSQLPEESRRVGVEYIDKSSQRGKRDDSKWYRLRE